MANTLILKTPEQVEGIRKSCHLSRKATKYIAPLLQAGVNTKYLDKKIEEFVRDHGGIPATLNYHGYPASSCISINDVICHGVPAENIIVKEGDLVKVDISTILNGFFGDTCMSYAIEPVSKEVKDIMKVTLECLNLGIKQCKPGNYIGNIGYVISEHAHKHRYSVVYQFCGHGVGLSLHEAPEVAHDADENTGPKMKAGMTFTIEPMINQGKARAKVDKKDGWTARTIDGKLSAQYEHTVLITESGVDVLTDIDNEY
ncbi:MAG: type I methionyl aminopeptidase [Bacteroidia bacterium]